MSSKVKAKVWRAASKSKSGFIASDGSAKVIGNRGNFIAADADGIAIAGNISFVTMSDQMRRGGLFLEMNDFVRMIPTTLVTPMPSQIPFPPLGIVSGISRDLPMFLSLLA